MHAWRYIKKLLKHSFIPGAHNDHRPRILHRPWLLFFLAVILATEGFLVSNLVARQSSQQFLAAVVPAEIIALTNTERADNNVGKLSDNTQLDAAAQAKAKDMAAGGYFSHVGPDGKTPWQWISASGYSYQYAGENLAVRFVDSTDVVNAWMASPTHRANVVKPVYTEIGVGVAQGFYQGEPATYVVQYFGSPLVAGVGKSAQLAAPVASAQTPVATNPNVEGASTQAAPVQTPSAVQVESAKQTSSFMQSFIKQVIRAMGEPQQSSAIVLSLIASIVIIALFFTFFTHIQIQHPNMLAAGAFVAFTALFFLAVNTHLVGGVRPAQSAGVIESQQGVVLTSEAAEVGYALFPQ